MLDACWCGGDCPPEGCKFHPGDHGAPPAPQPALSEIAEELRHARIQMSSANTAVTLAENEVAKLKAELADVQRQLRDALKRNSNQAAVLQRWKSSPTLDADDIEDLRSLHEILTAGREALMSVRNQVGMAQAQTFERCTALVLRLLQGAS